MSMRHQKCRLALGNAFEARGLIYSLEGWPLEYLRWWEEHVADQRIHGTTRQHV
jgi:hypothetical protein